MRYRPGQREEVPAVAEEGEMEQEEEVVVVVQAVVVEVAREEWTFILNPRVDRDRHRRLDEAKAYCSDSQNVPRHIRMVTLGSNSR